MTLLEKVNLVVLQEREGVENFNTGAPNLCIPALILWDGPDGIAGRVTGATQLPSELGIGASFDPALARAAGQVVGSEARTKGIDVVQGPDLNLVRVAQDGRAFDTYGEDPYLTSALGAADIEGIQSEGTMAMAKHFTAYTQETARTRLNQRVPIRALAELYNAPFEVAVKVAHVASMMCSVGSLNGVNTCSDPYIYSTLKSWGFAGFVRSDLRAVRSPAAGLRAGLSLIKPVSSATMIRLVHDKSLPVTDLNRAVDQVLTMMFAFGEISRPRAFDITQPATTPAHAALALRAAQEGIVLLKNAGGILPLNPNVASVAVIGADASPHPQVAGGGSSKVAPTFVVTPLSAIKADFGPGTRVSYAPGGPVSSFLSPLSKSDLVNGAPLPGQRRLRGRYEFGKADLDIDSASNVTSAIATAVHPGSGKGWSQWRAVLRVRQTGTYEVSLQQIGDTWLYVDGRQLLASRGLHAPINIATTLHLLAGHYYKFDARWFSVDHRGPPALGIANITGRIAAAVSAARAARVAIVFVGDFNSEGSDNANLDLPADANTLISDVAAVNHHTIVVLDTGGAVLMPWLGHVAGVIEAWYPGEQDGAAIASVLRGAFDPSGRLPISFPSSAASQPITSVRQFPGHDSVVNFGDAVSSLQIGYRWYQANGVKPLFSFGFGLSYTRFVLSHATLAKSRTGVAVRLTVADVGSTSGTDVVQAYAGFPSAAGEPPEQLRAFARVTLRAHSSRRVTIVIPRTGFQVFEDGGFTTVGGLYRVDIGQSSSNLPIRFAVTLP
jgi:beta-glucosidase